MTRYYSCTGSNDGKVRLFWENFYHSLEEDKHIYSTKMSNVNQYHNIVFRSLEEYKYTLHNPNFKSEWCSLESLQLDIEELTMHFDDNSVFKSSMTLL